MKRETNVLIEWCLVDGQRRHISEFSAISRNKLPDFVCPACSESLTPKWGEKRTHHLAHPSGSTCELTQPESALHFNAKCYVAEQLKHATRLEVVEPCVAWANQECHNTRHVLLFAGWNKVGVEYRIDPLKPDVVALFQDKPVGAIEVYFAHRVDERKVAILAEMGLPWAEVEADQLGMDTDSPWEAGQPLNVSRTFSGWRCPACEQALEEANKASKVEPETEQVEADRPIEPEEPASPGRLEGTYTYRPSLHHLIPRWFRIVDFYFPSGDKCRTFFIVGDLLESDGKVARCLVKRVCKDSYKTHNPEISDPELLCRVDAPLTKDRTRKLDQECEREINMWKRRKATVDSPMTSRWFEYSVDTDFFSDNWPARLRWNGKKGEWFPPRYMKTLEWLPDIEHDRREKMNQEAQAAEEDWRRQRFRPGSKTARF